MERRSLLRQKRCRIEKHEMETRRNSESEISFMLLRQYDKRESKSLVHLKLSNNIILYCKRAHKYAFIYQSNIHGRYLRERHADETLIFLSFYCRKLFPTTGRELHNRNQQLIRLRLFQQLVIHPRKLQKPLLAHGSAHVLEKVYRCLQRRASVVGPVQHQNGTRYLPPPLLHDIERLRHGNGSPRDDFPLGAQWIVHVGLDGCRIARHVLGSYGIHDLGFGKEFINQWREEILHLQF
mmetsp:Transcript_29262/g.63008  ORF Transcript_29262/g.63008 Transcript_29262/m.63008 type:complete len:238 (+) Transcript_29262:668-1381(+)